MNWPRLDPWVVLSLPLAAMAGWSLSSLGLPLSWVIGPMLVTAAMSLLGYPVFVDQRARRGGQIIVGSSIGLKLNSAALAGLWVWLPAAIVLNFALLFLALIFGRLFARFVGANQVSSYYAMVPGGLSEMANIAAKSGGSLEVVAIVQAMRVAVTVCALPPLLVWMEYHGQFDVSYGSAPLSFGHSVMVIACGILGALAVRKLRLNNPWMIGALCAGAALGISSVINGTLPDLVFCLGQMMIGMMIGSRFQMRYLRMIGRRLPYVFGLLFGLMSLMAILAALLSQVSPFDFASLLLAVAPGGFTEMATTATTLHLNVGLVVVFHVIRAFIINGFAEVIWRRFGRAEAPKS